MYVETPGDATIPISTRVVIVHVCNNVGAWGAGFVIPLGKRYPEARESYYKMHKEYETILGAVQFVNVEPEHDVYVANLIGQDNIRYVQNIPPVRYEAIREGLKKVREFCIEKGLQVQMPKIGSGLAGGNWEIISDIIQSELSSHNVPVTVLTID
jgi:O-acetyl-ADP-ribose deacetylase (regulator of RNase III)